MSIKKKIIIDNISKSYKMYNSPADRLKEAFSFTRKICHTDFFALSNVSFDVAEGEIVGVMGRNGAGKSTLLKIITGVLEPSFGNIKLSGRLSSLLELGAGFNMEYSGMDNIFFYGTLMGLSREEIDNKIEDIINFAEIGDYIFQPVKTYSSGMFARLAFSCAINVDPEILIVDEILSVGDIRFQAKCFKKFKEFKNKGVTTLYVGHDISTMRTFCDRCVWLNNGKIVDIGEPTYISAKYTEFMYLDDVSEFTEYKAFSANGVATGHSEQAQEEDAQLATREGQDIVEEPAKPDVQPDIQQFKELGKPLAHWGKKLGAVYGITVSVDGAEMHSCKPTDTVSISFYIHRGKSLDYKHLSAAISIKNGEGIDLIVMTTYDEKIEFVDNGKDIYVCFAFKPMLTNGEYYLVVALEDRKENIITYYEYIEGAKYFKIFESRQLFGRFLVEGKISINEV